MKQIAISIALCLLGGIAFAQKIEKALNIGDQMPDYKFPLFVNLNQKAIDFKKFRGKYVLLDVWASTCSSCVASIPHVQEMQNQFKDKLQIILVNGYAKDDVVYIKKVIARAERNSGLTISLPVTLFDKVLSGYFPLLCMPHEILINPEGKIIAITGADAITTENIKGTLEGKKVDYYFKDDFWNYNLPFVAQIDFKNHSNILVNSSLTGFRYSRYVDGWPKKNGSGENIGEFKANYPLIQLYQEAYYKELFSNDQIIVYQTKDTLFQNVSWSTHAKLFTWDITAPPEKIKEAGFIQRALQQDLDRVFNFSLRKDKRVLPCLVVRTNDNILKFKTKYVNVWESDNNFKDFNSAMKNHVAIFAYNVSASSIAWNFSSIAGSGKQFDVVRIFDESKQQFPLDIEFPVDFDFNNKDKLIAFLHEHGIDLVIENRELDCVIVSDKKPGDPTILN